MKRTVVILSLILFALTGLYSNKTANVTLLQSVALENIEALANDESGDPGCTASVSCGEKPTDFVRCNGKISCERRATTFERWVKCDGLKTSC